MKFVLGVMTTGLLLAQPVPPGPDPQAIEHRIEEIRSRLERNSVTDGEQKELAGFVQRYLKDAARALASRQPFQARCFTDAADACRRPLDHLEHLFQNGPGPKPPPDPQDHLRQVYFRLRLSEYFLRQIPPPSPRRLFELARGYYERGVKAREEGSTMAADEYAKSADDLTHALESLAQAAVR